MTAKSNDVIDPELREALDSDEMPKDILPMVWLGIKSIIRDNSSLRDDIQDIQLRTTNLEETNIARDEHIDSLQKSVEMMEAKMVRSDKIQQSLTNELDDLKSRSMRDNIIVNFDPAAIDFKEAKGENCVGLVLAFLRNVLGITDNVYIQTAHRIGKSAYRPMIARIPQSAQRSMIFKHANRLKDTRHYISQQLTPARSERRQFALPDYKQLKSDVKNKAVLAQDKLFVKNKLQTQFLKPNLPDRPLISNPSGQIAESRDKKDSGSVFHGYCAKASDLKDVADVRQYLITNKPDVTHASHVIYAYRLETRGKIQENYESDRDWGTGFELLKMMRHNNIVNSVCIATRLCNPGYSHIGKKRFTHINDACLQAFKSLTQ